MIDLFPSQKCQSSLYVLLSERSHRLLLKGNHCIEGKKSNDFKTKQVFSWMDGFLMDFLQSFMVSDVYVTHL